MIPLNSGRSVEVSLAMFMSFMAISRTCRQDVTSFIRTLDSYSELIPKSSNQVCAAETKTYFFVGDAGTGSPLLSSITKQRGESTQAKIIVVLFRQLLHCQGVQGEHFLSQELRGQRWRKRGQMW